MSNYRLGLVNKDLGRVIDLDKYLKTKKLKELDSFTSKYENNEKLKIFLYNEGLINSSELNYNLEIFYHSNGKINRIPVIYKPMQDYLSTENIIKSVYELRDDYNFLNKLYYHNKFVSYQYDTADFLYNFLDGVKKNNGRPQIYYEERLTNTINDMLNRIFKYNPNDTLSELNYNSIRKFGIFLYNYKLKLEQQKEKNEIDSQLSLFDYFKNSSNNDIIKVEEDDFEEPPFPPNSEEEKNYERYLEHLNEYPENFSFDEHQSYKK